jgi:glyoxylase-like metal-dependent hydrolase (beta-lactamase superfamily II)
VLPATPEPKISSIKWFTDMLDITIDNPKMWFSSERVAPFVTRLWEPHVHSFFRSNIWFVEGTDSDLVVDTGMGLCSLQQALPREPDKSLIAVATHVHVDHVGSFHEFDQRLGHPLEAEGFAEMPDSLTLAHMFREADEGITLLPWPDWKQRDYRVSPAGLTKLSRTAT